MAFALAERVGAADPGCLENLGDFFMFVGRTFMWMVAGGIRPKSLRLLMPQFYDIGVRSVPVVAIVGAFIGMVMAVETYSQFDAIGQEIGSGASSTCL